MGVGSPCLYYLTIPCIPIWYMLFTNGLNMHSVGRIRVSPHADTMGVICVGDHGHQRLYDVVEHKQILVHYVFIPCIIVKLSTSVDTLLIYHLQVKHECMYIKTLSPHL